MNITTSKDTREILMDILTCIDYENDKQAYADRFIALTKQSALLQLYNSLSIEKKKQFEKEFGDIKDQQDSLEKFHGFFNQQQIQESVNNAFLKLFQDFFTSIEGKMTPKQKRNMKKYIKTLE